MFDPKVDIDNDHMHSALDPGIKSLVDKTDRDVGFRQSCSDP